MPLEQSTDQTDIMASTSRLNEKNVQDFWQAALMGSAHILKKGLSVHFSLVTLDLWQFNYQLFSASTNNNIMMVIYMIKNLHSNHRSE